MRRDGFRLLCALAVAAMAGCGSQDQTATTVDQPLSSTTLAPTTTTAAPAEAPATEILTTEPATTSTTGDVRIPASTVTDAEGLRLTLSVDDTVIEAGEELLFALAIDNITDQEIAWIAGVGGADITGNDRPWPGPGCGEADGTQVAVLGPGQQRRYENRYPLTCDGPLPAGAYLVTGEFIVCSDPVYNSDGTIEDCLASHAITAIPIEIAVR